MKRPLISLGDALHAVTELLPRDDAARTAIREMLGLSLPMPLHTPRTLGPWQSSSSDNVVVAQRRTAPAPLIRTTEPAAEPRLATGITIASSLRLVRSGNGRFPPPAWLVAPGKVLDTSTTEDSAASAPQLFSTLTQRAIVAAALAVQVPEGELDLPRIIEVLCTARPLNRLLRLPRPTLRLGAQVLIDRGPGMDPYSGDQKAVATTLRRMLPGDRVRFLDFMHCPTRGVGAGPRETWGAWRRPPAGTPIIVLTDLGIGGPRFDDERSSSEEWLAFARNVIAAGCLLVAFVPYEASRWPTALSRSIRLIHWSERTTAGQVARAKHPPC